jgi:MoaA/NifB/PqqE/SkfB family radical SAM enzyme
MKSSEKIFQEKVEIMKKIYASFYLILLELRRIIFRVKYIAEVDVTDNCNLRCKHCYHFHGKDEFQTKELSLDVWRKRFNGLHKAGIRFILLVGGEPALRNDILMLAESIFPFVYLITNGTIKISTEFNHVLFVSLDGLRERNDSIRGKGVFSKVMKNYSGDKRVVLNMTITKDNYKELKDIVKLAKENGFRGVMCNICASGINVEIPISVRKNERKMIIEELKRVKSLYPKDFLLGKQMIKWYEYPDHTGSCYWGDEVLHFDVSWNRRRCFAKADCSNCGCMAGSIQNPLRMLQLAS